jgi:hypothetical protein
MDLMLSLGKRRRTYSWSSVILLLSPGMRLTAVETVVEKEESLSFLD